MAAELRQMYQDDPDVRRVVDVARGLEGLRRQDGIHAAAVVITRDPLTDYLPIQRKPDASGNVEESPVVTQYEMHGVEDLGLLKMDFLGLRNLDVMEIALDLIERSTGQRVDLDTIALDDPLTFDMLRAADTIGVFQLEGGPMRQLIARLAPTTFEDVAALVALYRPGPMAQNWHNEYADRKNGRKPVSYDHPDLEEILAPTFGLMIYQEQLMRVSQRLAGYTLEEADNLRKATGKKIRELIAKERTKFVSGCEANGHSAAFAQRYFDTIEPFADYSFNKSHSVGYGLVAYQTAYLKANFPVQYLAALLTSVKSNLDKAAVYINECRLLDIPVLNPCVNDSEIDFAVRFRSPDQSPEPVGARAVGERGAVEPLGVRAAGERGAIRFGLSAVRNVGDGVAEMIVRTREEGGPFADFYDYCDRVPDTALNKRALESLIKAGAFDALGHTRQGLLMVFEQITDQAMSRRKEREQGRMSFFDLEPLDGAPPAFDQRAPIPEGEFDKSRRLALEKEMLGLYVSDHPLMGARRALARLAECSVADLLEADDGTMRNVAGIVTGLQR
jgi:DNA polymerase-3 subunit alpha